MENYQINNPQIICQNCGSKIPSGQNSCPNCGKKITIAQFFCVGFELIYIVAAMIVITIIGIMHDLTDINLGALVIFAIVLIIVMFFVLKALRNGVLQKLREEEQSNIGRELAFEKHDENIVAPNFCSSCGSKLLEGQKFCSQCGKKCYRSFKASNRTAIIAVIVIAILASVFSYFMFVDKNFNIMYSDLADEIWCEIAEDGSWMKIDTNPYDIEDYFSFEADAKIESVLSDLGFPSYVFEDMGTTRALDGKQTASTDKYEVSWTYHPSNGLAVIFKIKY